jgi:hypothetical protein
MQDRLPTLDLVQNSDLRTQTITLIEDHTPDYFWEVPAATTYNNHNPYSCATHGLWIHTLMTCTAYETMVDSAHLSDPAKDYGRIACILHDMRKYGDTYDDTGTARDHDIQMASLIRQESDLPEAVTRAVASHMGPWYDGPEPTTNLQTLVHRADMIASTKNITCGIYEKPQKISELYPALPSANL